MDRAWRGPVHLRQGCVREQLALVAPERASDLLAGLPPASALAGLQQRDAGMADADQLAQLRGRQQCFLPRCA